MHRLGVSPQLTFHEVYSLDEPSLLACVPRPAYALLFISPGAAYHKLLDNELSSMPVYDGSGEAEPVMWFKQTIGNACGLIGLLHAVSNGVAKQHIKPGSNLEALLAQAVPLKPEARAELLYQSSLLEAAHGTAAQEGDTEAPSSESAVNLHFVCFVKDDDGNLWELDGGRNGPVKRGVLGPDEDVLGEEALKMGVRRFLDQAEAVGDSRFSLIALAHSYATEDLIDDVLSV